MSDRLGMHEHAAPPSVPGPDVGSDETSIKELAKRLVGDGRALVRQEVDLAKTEVLETAGKYARASGVIAAGILVLLIGLGVLLAFLLLALGAILGGRYWLSTLLVGLVIAIGGMITLRRGKARLARESVVPGKSIESLRATAGWAAEQTARLRSNDTPGGKVDHGEDSR